MVFTPLRNSDHVVVSVSIDFPTHSERDALSHCIAYDYSHADWNGLSDHLNSVLLLLLEDFLSGFRLELMNISLIVSIRSSLTHLHDSEQLVGLLRNTKLSWTENWYFEGLSKMNEK